MSNILTVLVNDRPVTTYPYKNETFIEGRSGSRFKLKITNPFSSRVKAIVSVDGLSVIDGEPAGDNSQGYLISGFSSMVIDGWRISDAKVREFFFTALENSYNNKTSNDTNNVGVIAVKLFCEKIKPIYANTLYSTPYHTTLRSPTAAEYHWYDDSALRGVSLNASYSVGSAVPMNAALSASGASIPTMDSYIPSNEVGTGMGQEKYSYSHKVDFEAQSYPSSTVVLYYDSLQGLEKRGIDVKRINYRPNPFPGNFCKQV